MRPILGLLLPGLLAAQTIQIGPARMIGPAQMGGVAAGGTPISIVETVCRDHALTAGCSNGSADTTTSTVTFGTPTTSGELIFALTLGAVSGTSSGTMTDSGSQTYSTDANNSKTGLGGSHFDVTFWYKCNSASGITSLTWTPEALDTAANSAFIAGHAKGMLAGACNDASVTWNAQQGTPFTGPSSGTLAQAKELVISGLFANGSVATCVGSTIAGTSGWTNQHQAEENSDGGVIAILTQIVAATTAVSPTGTGSISATCYNLGVMSFKGS